MEKENFELVKQLLAAKRNELPSQEYFDGVLPEFHRRQRAALLKPASPWRAWWSEFVESFTLDLSPSLRYAAASLVAVALVAAGWHFETGHGSATSVASVVSAPKSSYAFEQTFDKKPTADENLDAATIQTVNAKPGAQPKYVLSAERGTELALAF